MAHKTSRYYGSRSNSFVERRLEGNQYMSQFNSVNEQIRWEQPIARSKNCQRSNISRDVFALLRLENKIPNTTTNMFDEAATVIIVVTVVLNVFATIAVGLRLHCRKLQRLPLGADDYCVLITLVKDAHSR